jgi:hypothetical protein
MLESPALVYAGLITTIYGTAIWLFFGIQSWIAIFFVYAIGVHFLVRFIELSYARQVVSKRRE